MKRILFLLTLLFPPLAAQASVCPSVPYTFVNGTIADATQVNADFTTVLGCLNTGLANSGANNNITSLTGLISPPSGSGSIVFSGIASNTGTANAIIVSNTSPTGFTLTAGDRVWFKSLAKNTSALTVAVDGLAPTNVYKLVGPTNGIATLGSITGGSNYQPGYHVASLTGGTGTGAIAGITVNSSGVVTAVSLYAAGNNYAVADTLSASTADLGPGGTSFSIPVATVAGGALTALTGGEIAAAGEFVDLLYDGTQFQLLSPVPFNPWTAAANTFLAGPTSGGAVVTPGFRPLSCNDLPAGGWCLLNTVTASNSATLSDTTSLTSQYTDYELVLENIVPATSGTFCLFQVYSNGSVQTTGYLDAMYYTSSSASTGTNIQPTYIPCTFGALYNAVPGLGGTINILNAQNTSAPKNILLQTINANSSSAMTPQQGGGYWNGGNTAITGFRLSMASGNITSGTIKIYGRN
jgi:hypothetical protein